MIKFLSVITILFSNFAYSQTTYTFIGNGNWTDSSNWANNKRPSPTLESGSQIIINPGGNGECILDTLQVISNGAVLTVEANKRFTINNSLEILDAIAALFTNPVDSITTTTAVSGGNISNDSGFAITAKGVVWSTAQEPTIALSTKTSNGTGIGYFNGTLTGLSRNTTYYVKAYAINSLGTAYGNEVSFKTDLGIYTNELRDITPTSATGGGFIYDDGSVIIARGVVYSITTNPTVDVSAKTVDGAGAGSFSSSLQGLSPNTTYYVRAYATSSGGTAYGNEIKVFGWMPKNLEVITYRNGDLIPQVTDPAQWATLTTGAWCYYNNDSSLGTVYGKLYNWYAINDFRGLAPQGWHIPAGEEWDAYINYLGGEYYGGGKMKTTNLWYSPNTGATDESGFSARPGGYRDQDGTFGGSTLYGGWISTQVSGSYVYSRSLSFNGVVLTRNYGGKQEGYSVRCIKD